MCIYVCVCARLERRRGAGKEGRREGRNSKAGVADFSEWLKLTSGCPAPAPTSQ